VKSAVDEASAGKSETVRHSEALDSKNCDIETVSVLPLNLRAMSATIRVTVAVVKSCHGLTKILAAGPIEPKRLGFVDRYYRARWRNDCVGITLSRGHKQN
jgi:hypothetical protein